MRHSRWRLAIELAAWCAAIAIPFAIFGLHLAIVIWLGLLIYTPILLFCLSGRMALPLPVQRLLEAAGNTTYSCYLLHFPIRLLIAIAFSYARLSIPLYDRWFCAAFLATTLLASHLIYRYFEAPAQKLIRSYLLRKEEAGLEGKLQPRSDLPTV